MNYILSCGCGNTDQFAKDAAKILFPEANYDLILGVDTIRDFIMTQDLPPKVEAYLRAYAESKDKFALYLQDNKGLWNLMKGKKIC